MVVLTEDFIWMSGLILFVVFVISLIIFSIFFLKIAKKNSIEKKSKDIYGYSIALFFLIVGISYSIRVYFMFFLPSNKIIFIFNLVFDERLDPLIQLFWQIHMAIAFLGISALMIGVETQIFTKFHYVISAITLILSPILVLVPYDLAHTLYILPMGTPIIIILIYIYVGIQNPGLVRKNSFAIVIGWLIFILGILLNSTTMRQLFFPNIFPFNPILTMLISYKQYDLPGLIFFLSMILNSESGAVISVIFSPISLIIGFLIQAAGYSRKFK